MTLSESISAGAFETGNIRWLHLHLEVKRRPMFDALATIFFVIGFVNVEKVKERNKVVYSGAGFLNRMKTTEHVK